MMTQLSSPFNLPYLITAYPSPIIIDNKWSLMIISWSSFFFDRCNYHKQWSLILVSSFIFFSSSKIIFFLFSLVFLLQFSVVFSTFSLTRFPFNVLQYIVPWSSPPLGQISGRCKQHLINDHLIFFILPRTSKSFSSFLFLYF